MQQQQQQQQHLPLQSTSQGMQDLLAGPSLDNPNTGKAFDLGYQLLLAGLQDVCQFVSPIIFIVQGCEKDEVVKHCLKQQEGRQ